MKIRFITICILSFLFVFSLNAQTRSYKRGISYEIPSTEDVEALTKGLTWYYNWGHLPPDDAEILAAIEKYKLDFIPMTWNGGINKEKLRDYYSKNPQVKYILGFNEPNFLEQANMTPTEAAAKWKDIEEIADEFDLKIVSPAVNYAPANGAVSENGKTYTDPVDWLDDFFAACTDCRVDYVAFHCYMGTVGGLKGYAERLKKYGKPLWLTEFCAWENNITDSWQKNYLVESVNYLESDPDIYRYSWFIGRAGATGSFPYMQLLGRYAGQLTEKGEIYVNMSSFDNNFYHQVNDTIQAEQYVNLSEGIHLEKTTDVSGNISLSDFLITRWTEYNVDVPESGEYELKVRVANQYPAKFEYSVDGNIIGFQDIEVTGGLDRWATLSSKLNLQAGKQKIRIDVSAGRANLNWFILSDGKSSISNSDIKPVNIYPNPATDILNIEYEGNIQYTLSDLTGKPLQSGDYPGTLDISGYPRGLYLLTIELSGNQRIVEKIIKK